MNPVMEKINPHVDVGKHPVCYKSFNVPPVMRYVPIARRSGLSGTGRSILRLPTPPRRRGPATSG